MARPSIAIVGAGFSGVGMAIRLRQEGFEDFVVLERAADFGGTWRDNTYPGCACDVPSHLYSYSFAPNPEWSRVYPPQREIWEYLRRCADGAGVTSRIRCGHGVLGAAWDAGGGRWRIDTTHGPLHADVLISAVGGLTEPAIPDIPGLDAFEGTKFHSAAWNHDHDLSGRRVAVIGTGASAIQFVPRIHRKARRLHVFQRTPPWILPHPQRRISELERRLFRRLPAAQQVLRAGIYGVAEGLGLGITVDPRLLRPLENAARAHLRRQIDDPGMRRVLEPSYRIGCKRILLSNSYYPALAQPHVELVTDGIERVGPRSLVTTDGTEREVDTIILGTGFRILDFSRLPRVTGTDGRSLAEAWSGRPEAYLGTTVAGFPNLFTLVGPHTGLGHNSLLYMIESQIAYVLDALRTMRSRGLASVEVRPEVQAEYNAKLQARSGRTVWLTGGCASWYLNEAGENASLWPGFTFTFRRQTRRFRAADYMLARGAAAVEEAAA